METVRRSVRWKPVVILILVAFITLYLALHLIKIIYRAGDNTDLWTYNRGFGNKSAKFTYSNELVFIAINSIREHNCEPFTVMFANRVDSERGAKSKDAALRNICTAERRRVVDNVTDNQWVRRLPGAIIIGTYKSGTRELIDFLQMNPQVVIRRTPSYEVAYFDMNAAKSLDWYKNEMPLSLPGQITIEKSPSYFYSEQTPSRIHAMNSSIKLILMVRDPIERAISEFSFDDTVAQSQYGGSFYNCAVDAWTKEVNGNCFVIRHSVYDTPISRYLRYFDRKQILIIDAAEFRRNPFKILQDVETHLGLNHVVDSKHFVYNPHKACYCVTNIRNREAGVCYDTSRGRTSYDVNVSDDVKHKLGPWFKEHNERFFNLSGKRFAWS